MAPLPPPRETADGKPPPPATGVPRNCLLFSALGHLPPFSPSSSHRPLPAKPARADGAALVGQFWVLPTSLASAAERWVRALRAAVAGNGFLAPLLGLPANFQRFCQHSMRSLSEHFPGTYSTSWRSIGSISYTGLLGSECLHKHGRCASC